MASSATSQGQTEPRLTSVATSTVSQLNFQKQHPGLQKRHTVVNQKMNIGNIEISNQKKRKDSFLANQNEVPDHLQSPNVESAYGPSQFKMGDTIQNSALFSKQQSEADGAEPSASDSISVREDYDAHSRSIVKSKKRVNHFINSRAKTLVKDPATLKGMLLQNVQGSSSDFVSLRQLTMNLSRKIEDYAMMGRVPRLDYVEHGTKDPRRGNGPADADYCDHNHKSDMMFIKNFESTAITRWDGEGGYEGFAQWLVTDRVGRKQRTVAELAKWIDELEPQQIGVEIDKYFAAQDAFEEKVENIRECSANVSIRDSMHGASVMTTNAAGGGGPPKPRTRAIPHHELDQVKRMVSGFARNDDFYRRCTSQNIIMRNNAPPPGSMEYYDQMKPGQQDNEHPKILRDCNRLLNRLHERSHPTLKTRPMLCEAEMMQGYIAPEEALPWPLPFGDEHQPPGSHDAANAEFASNPNFLQRNMAAGPEMHVIPEQRGREPQGIRRCIVTEYSIEDWYAQSLGMSTEEYLTAKRRHARQYKVPIPVRENLYPTEDFPDKPRKPVVIKEVDDEESDSNYSQITANKSRPGGMKRADGGSKSAAELATIKTIGGQPVEAPVQRSLLDIIKMGRDKRGYKKVEERSDLQPRLCNKYDKEKSYVVAIFGGYGRKHIPKENINELRAQVSHLDGAGVIARAGGGAPAKAQRPSTAATPGLKRSTTATFKKQQDDTNVEMRSDDSGAADNRRTTQKAGRQANLIPAHQRVLMNEFGGFKDKLIQKCYEQTLKASRKKVADATKKKEGRSLEEERAGGKAEATAVKNTQKSLIKQLLRENKDKNDVMKLKRREAFLKRIEQDRAAKAEAGKRSRNGHAGIPQKTNQSMDGLSSSMRPLSQNNVRRPKPYALKTTQPGAGARPAPTRSQIEGRAHQLCKHPSHVPMIQQKSALSVKSAAVLHEANHFDPYLKLVGLQEMNAIQKAKNKLLAAQYRRGPQQAPAQFMHPPTASESTEPWQQSQEMATETSEERVPTYGFGETRTIELGRDMLSRNMTGANQTAQPKTGQSTVHLSFQNMPKRPSEVNIKPQLTASQGFRRGRSGDRAVTSSTGFTASAAGGAAHPYDWPRRVSNVGEPQRPQSVALRPRMIHEARTSGVTKRQNDLLLCASYQLDAEPAVTSMGRKESRETIEVDEALSSIDKTVDLTGAKIPPNWIEALEENKQLMAEAVQNSTVEQRVQRNLIENKRLRYSASARGGLLGTFDRSQVLGMTRIDEQDFDNMAIEVEMRRVSSTSTGAFSKTPKKINQQKSLLAPGSENLFYTMNRTVKGMSVTRESQVRLRQTTQDLCFDNQKRELVSAAAERTAARTSLQKTQKIRMLTSKPDQSKALHESDMTSPSKDAGTGALGTLATTIQPTTLVVLKTDPERMQSQILAEVKRDNDYDIKNPFVAYEGDRRAFKIGLYTKDIQPPESLRNQKFKFDEEQFWFLKGYDHVHCDSPELDSAIDSYCQALRIQPVQADVMHNLACVYETQQRFELAIKWFDIAIQTDPENEKLLDSYYGAALCFLKNGEPLPAIEKLSQAIILLGGRDIRERKMMHKYYFRYLRAICYRVSGEYKKAEADYVAVKKHFDIQEGTQYCHKIFAMIIMPNERDRRQLQKFVEQFQDVIDMYEVPKDRRIVAHAYIEGKDMPSRPNQDPKWADRKILDICTLLSETSFFKRFSFPRIRELMDKMTLRVFNKDSILFFQPNKVYVIISGSLQMKCHQKRTDLPQTYAKFQSGSIMNFLRDGVEIFNSIETWFLAQVQTEVAVFDKAYFESVWNEDIMTQDLMLKRKVLRCYPIFQQLSTLAIMSLVSEYINFKTFKKGELLTPQSLSAPTSEKFQEMLASHEQLHTAKETLKKQQQQLGMRQPALCLHKRGHADEHKHHEEEVVMREGLSNVMSILTSAKARTPAAMTSIDHGSDAGDAVPTTDDVKLDMTKLEKSRAADKRPAAKQPESYRGAKARAGGREPGVYVVTRGRCVVVNPADGYRACHLQGGEIFGEADLLKIVGYEFFGDIIADSDDVECMFISTRDFREIPDFEKHTMKEFANQRLSIRQLAYRYSERYKKPYADFIHYYSTTAQQNTGYGQRRN